MSTNETPFKAAPPSDGCRPTQAATALTLTNEEISWSVDWSDARLVSEEFQNKLTGSRYQLAETCELTLVFSESSECITESRVRLADFEVTGSRLSQENVVAFDLRGLSAEIEVVLHLQLDGPVRRKWVEVTNKSDRALLLLDVELDRFSVEGVTTGGGFGQPVFLDREIFAAIEHPAGTNTGQDGQVLLAHFPGRRLERGEKFRSQTALVSVTPKDRAQTEFLAYIEARSRPREKMLSIYTPFGINNQFGACSTLDDEQALDVVELLGKLKKKGVSFDYFTLDTGWVDFSSDLTQFKPTSFPAGPAKLVEKVQALEMKFGLWFAVSWGLQSCWDYPPAFPDGKAPVQEYREGYSLGLDGVNFCPGDETYFSILKKAVLHHVRENKVRLLKFDGIFQECDSTSHNHLPGKYSIEAIHNKLIDIADSARAIAPDVFVMWYWGLRSPFWAMHGDSIFESGLHMEGSATSSTPTLYYRDSVTLAQDQNAHNAKNIPPRLKDSLGVWLSNTRWGNFMATERWRETLVMDLGRGSRLFPNIWGNLYDLTDDDAEFLGWITNFAKENASLFANRKLVLGDPFINDTYGYAHGTGSRSLVFLNNAHFASRRVLLPLDESLGLEAGSRETVEVFSHFPDKRQLPHLDGRSFQVGDSIEIWLRPFETLMIEIAPQTGQGKSLPIRDISEEAAAQVGVELALQPAPLDERMNVRFADAALFAQKSLVRKNYVFESTLPLLEGDQPILAIVIRLRKDQEEWKYAPTVVQIIQALARVGDQNVQLVPVPDGRQYGNTQSLGCSWIIYKVRLNPQWSHQPLKLAIHANLPTDVEAHIESWVVKRWWKENTRPLGDGYYANAPS